MDATGTDAYAEYIIGWREHEQQTLRRIQERAVHAKAAAEKCARFLATTYKVQRVWLFGSLVQPTRTHARTDIDLAVEGLAPDAYFAALAGMYALVEPGVEIDLVPIEIAQPAIRQRILSEGQVLYESQHDSGSDC